MLQIDTCERIVKCAECGEKTVHNRAHECFYNENTHIAGTECWICSVCGRKITPNEAHIRHLDLPFFHDRYQL